MREKTPRSLLAILVMGLLTVGCDWVDSTGAQQAPTATTTEVFLDDIPVGDVSVINEDVESTIITRRTTESSLEQTFEWSREPVLEGKLEACANLPDFNSDLATNTFAEACSSSSDCDLVFEAVDSNPDEDIARFILKIPELNAPVGVRYELSVGDSSGAVNVKEYDFCLISINEAPVAKDDTFVVTEGVTLNVTQGTNNLLSNDYDDEDVSNTAFEIDSTPVDPPKNADFFELGTDGSFTYRSRLSNLREDQLDSFVYGLSDGRSTSTARATIRIVAANQAPEQVGPISALMGTEGVEFSVDFSEMFVDPENVAISFSLSDQTPLATGSGLSLSSGGILSGTPTSADVGSYSLNLLVSDGGLETQAKLTLQIDTAPIVESTNSAPEFVSGGFLSRIVFVGTAVAPIVPSFTDPDGDVLSYSMNTEGTLPVGFSLNPRTGRITGRPLATAIGFYSGLRIRATDPSGASALSSPFFLDVRGGL